MMRKQSEMSRLDFCSWALEYEDFIARGTVENRLLDMDKIESFINKSLDAPDYMFIAQVPYTGWSPHDVECINFDDYNRVEELYVDGKHICDDLKRTSFSWVYAQTSDEKQAIIVYLGPGTDRTDDEYVYDYLLVCQEPMLDLHITKEQAFKKFIYFANKLIFSDNPPKDLNIQKNF